MDCLRVSASDLDAFRYFMNNEEAELSDLLAQLRRETPPTQSMLAGTALHYALEHSKAGSFDKLEANGFTFDLNFDAELDLPDIREVKATKDIKIDDCLVTLVGKVDAIHGRRVDDHKFTSRYDAERFLGSYQWRIYLDVFDADEFRWNVFEGRPDTKDPQHYIINNMHPLKMHRYPGMPDDIKRALSAFVAFARAHMPERFTGPEIIPHREMKKQLQESAAE